MPFYKVNSYGPNELSARHPFHGMVQGAAKKAAVIRSPEGRHYEEEGLDPFDYDYRQLDRRYYYTVQGYGLDAGQLWDESKSPLLKGLLAGVVAFGVSKAVGAGGSLALKLGIVMGVLEAGVGIATEQLISGATAGQATPEQQAVASVKQPVTPSGVVKVTE